MGQRSTWGVVSESRRRFLVKAGLASAAGAAINLNLFGCGRSHAPLQHFKGTTAGHFDLGPRTTPKLSYARLRARRPGLA